MERSTWLPRQGLPDETPGFDGYIGGVTAEGHVAFLCWSEADVMEAEDAWSSAGAMPDALSVPDERTITPAAWYLKFIGDEDGAVYPIGSEGGDLADLPRWDDPESRNQTTLDLAIERAALYVDAWDWAGRPEGISERREAIPRFLQRDR